MVLRSKQYEDQKAKDEITQHAKKIDQGFRRLNETDSQRAIWELFQNAIDLAGDTCDIRIEIKDNQLIFTHNSEVFTPRDLSSLNKQYSLKDIENNNDGVGQYGTGFISTHSFGKSLKIDSSLKFNDEYAELSDFPINRTYTTLKELEKNIEAQENHIKVILDTCEFFDSPTQKLTSFKYAANDEKEIEAAKFSIKQVEKLIPLVFTFCDKLNVVRLESDEDSFKALEYKRVGSPNDKIRHNSFFYSKIECNKKEIITRYIAKYNDDESVRYKVVFPMDNDTTLKSLADDISRLFLFYPLIGSHSFGFNFIIHSKDFFVNEKRSSIELQSDNPKLAKDEELNRNLMEEISNDIFTFLDRNIVNIENSIEIAPISFGASLEQPFLCEYFNEYQTKWVNKYLQLKLIDTYEGRKNATEVFFIEQELINDNEHFNDLYQLISKLEWDKPLPELEIAKRWTEIVGQWKSDEIEYITLDLLLGKIEQKKLSDLPKSELLIFYQFMIKKEWYVKFEHKRLLPNYNGTLCLQHKLNKGVNIHSHYFDSINVIIPRVMEKLVDPDFTLSLSFKEYNRQNLYDDFKMEFESYFAIGQTQINEHDREKRIKQVAQLCNITSIIGAQNHRTELVRLIKDKYDFEIDEIIVPNIENDKFDYDSTPFSTLMRLVAIDIMHKTNLQNGINIEHLSFVKEFVSSINKIRQHKTLLDNLVIFPNQLGKLCRAIEVSKEKDFLPTEEDNDFLKETYKDVIGEDVRQDLVDNYFIEGFEALKATREAKAVAGKIDEAFKLEKLDEINSHKHRLKIFEIIKRMTENDSMWPSLFPNLEIKKEIILMSKMTNTETKNDLFKIISLDDPKKIRTLSHLAEVDDLDALIKAGQEKQKEDARRKKHLGYINDIGLMIQKIIQNELDSSLAETISIIESVSDEKLENIEEQGGQDFIIYKSGNPIYYIEVKSRWDSDGIVALSKRQIERCAENKGKYAVVTVNVADYKSRCKTAIEKDITFEQLSVDTYVNLDLSDNFGQLIKENKKFEQIKENTRLVEFRGHIPQSRIRKEGVRFAAFIEELKTIILS